MQVTLSQELKESSELYCLHTLVTLADRKTAAHAHSSEGAKRAIRAGIDSIEHGTFLDDEALDMMKARGTVLIPTLMGVAAHVKMSI